MISRAVLARAAARRGRRAYGRGVSEDPAEIRRRKRLSNRTVLAGVVLMGTALQVSMADLVPPLFSTAMAVVGFVLLLYGVHVGWVLFYDRESDGPPS